MTTIADTFVSAEVQEVPLALIAAAPDNPRRDVGDVAELAQSMSELGLLQPLVVTPRDHIYMVVCGHRRFAAAQHAGLTSVPCLVRELDETQRRKAMIIENCQREGLTPLEEARGYAGLVELGLTQREIADSVGRGQSHISKRLALLELPAKVLKDVDSGGITIADALELAKLKDHPQRITAALKRMREWNWPGESAVKKELEELALEQKIAKAEAKLKADGVKVLQFRKSTYGEEPPKNAIEVKKGASWGHAFDLNPAEHAKSPCHGAAVDRHGEIRYFCTDRKQHPKLKTADERNRVGATRQKSEAAVKHEREIREATKARRDFVRQLLAKPPAKNELVDVVVHALIRHTQQATNKTACQLLDLDPDAYEQASQKSIGNGSGGYQDRWELALHDAAHGRTPGALGVGLAIALAGHEERISREWGSWKPYTDYFTWLDEHGYQISPAEKRELTGKRPR